MERLGGSPNCFLSGGEGVKARSRVSVPVVIEEGVVCIILFTSRSDASHASLGVGAGSWVKGGDG